MAAIVVGIRVRLCPALIATPRRMVRPHVGAIADAKQQRAVRPVGVFMDFADRVYDECARNDVDRLGGRAHRAAALETEIDFGGVGMAMIRADLAGLPARDRYVAFADAAENLFDVKLGVPFLLPRQTEDMHESAPPSSRLFVPNPSTRPRKHPASVGLDDRHFTIDTKARRGR